MSLLLSLVTTSSARPVNTGRDFGEQSTVGTNDVTGLCYELLGIFVALKKIYI
uniref:Uncharacterized protein n=1 Tax=Anguilla anguilla TaxID=7936 RepID=A0A0E9RTV6_ANGAN